MVALYKVLQIKVFLPLIEHVEQRENATVGATETTSLLRQKAAALQERYEREMFQARVEANTIRLEIIQQAKVEASRIASAAEAEVAAILKGGRAQIAKQLDECRLKGEGESQALAKLLLHKVDSELSVH